VVKEFQMMLQQKAQAPELLAFSSWCWEKSVS
jgi:hypothetical protein